MSWRSQDDRYSNRKLRIGVIKETDGVVTVHLPITRALDLVVAALEADGHEVFEWKPTGHKDMSDLMVKNTFSHGYPVIKMVTDTGEPLLPTLAGFEAAYDGSGSVFTAETQRDMSILRDHLRDEYFDRWAATATDDTPEMDAILTPLSPWVMPPLGAVDKTLNLSFTNFVNVLGESRLRLSAHPESPNMMSVDSPACVLPVTFVDRNVDKKRAAFNPIDSKDAVIQSDYDPDRYDGVPVCVQLVGRRLQEERLVAVVKKIDKLLKRH